MIIDEASITLFNPSEGKRAAIDIARDHYEKWKREAEEKGRKTVSFDEDRADYERNGLVICRHDIFGMAKVGQFKGELAWFVRVAVGDLRTLIAELPAPFKWICFTRRNDPRVRGYSMERLVQLATKRKG